MTEFKAGSAEARFAELIWENEPISSGQLAKLGAQEFEWKKTTSFTVLKRLCDRLKRLCDRGIFRNQNGTVTSLVSREEYYARQSRQYVEETFGGSLPAFLAAFGSRQKLSDREVEELKQLIENMRG